MSDGLFIKQDEHVFLPSDSAVGPWNPGLLHGGATAGLIAYVLEKHEPEANKQYSRITLDMFRPVPKEALTVSARTVRAGKKISVVEVSVMADGKEVAKATALKIQKATLGVPDYVQLPACSFALPDTLESLSMMGARHSSADKSKLPAGLNYTLEVKRIDGFDGKGKGRAWFKAPVPVVAGQPITPLTHLGVLSDFGNGLAQLFIPGTAGSINADISLYINRLPQGEWVGLESQAVMSDAGIGRVSTTLYDERGAIGCVEQMTMAQLMA
ncbi:MAG TPA: thioesterase family protein [Pseudomonadales bacterium]